MGVVTGILVSVGLLFTSSLIAKKPKDGRDGLGEDTPGTLATRGEYENYVIGTRRVGPLVGWVGGWYSREEGGGGGKGSPDVPGQKVWYGHGWHQLHVGPTVTALRAIFINDEMVWSPATTPTPFNTPSGSSLTVEGTGSFTIYWGEPDQPINTWLGRNDRVGIASRWPSLCYVVWTDFKLGSSKAWPDIEYVITVQCEGNAIAGSDYTAGSDYGVNPAHALYQILTGPPPHGLGYDPDRLDKTTLEALGTTLANESLDLNILHDRGGEASRTIEGILQDMGVSMPQVGSRLMFIGNREPSGSVPDLSDDVVLPPDLERKIDRGEKKVSREVFTYKSQAGWRFRETDIKHDDDGEADQVGRVSARRIPLATVTGSGPANTVANRRALENTVNGSFKLRATRGARRLMPGQTFTRSGFGRLRVLSNRWSGTSPFAELEVTPDTYGTPPIPDVQDAGGASGTAKDVAKDLAFAFMELPASLTQENAIAVLRHRAHRQIAGAFVHVSDGGANYTLSGNQDSAAAGGLLESSLLAGTAETVATGPVFEDVNGDAVEILDLSSDTSGWQAGRQVAIINDEAFFLESVTVQSETAWSASEAISVGDVRVPTTSNGLRFIATAAGTTGSSEPSWPNEIGDTITDGGVTWAAHGFAYQMNNLIRAQYSTVQQDHVADDRVYIIEHRKLAQITAPQITAGTSLCVKTQPFTSSQTVDLSAVTGVCKTILGLGEPVLDHLIDHNFEPVVDSGGDTIETVEFGS